MPAITSSTPYAGGGGLPAGTLLNIPGHTFLVGDAVRVAGHSGADPDINGDWYVTYSVAGAVIINAIITTGGTGGTAELSPLPPSVVVPIQLKTGNTSEVAAYVGGILAGGTQAEPVWDKEAGVLYVVSGAAKKAVGTPGVSEKIEDVTLGISTKKIRTLYLSAQEMLTDMIFLSKGEALGEVSFCLGNPADGTNNGGEFRGGSAVDLQQRRTAPENVAGGTWSCILAGIDNRTVPQFAVAMGKGAYSYEEAAFTQAHGFWDGSGDAQTIFQQNIAATSNATPAIMGGQVPGKSQKRNKMRLIDLRIVAKAQGAAEGAAFHRRLLNYVADDGTSSIIGAVQTIGTDIKSSGASAWDITIAADGLVSVIGAAATNIRWIMDTRITEVKFPA